MTINEVQDLGQRHLSEFRALALTLTHDEERARDLLQDVSYLMLKHRDTFKAGTNFSAWAKTIIRNTFISDYRQQKRRRELVIRDRPEAGWIGDHAITNPAESHMGAEEIMVMVNELPAKYRRAFLLHYRGVKYKDIARMMNIPLGTAKSRVFTARKMLKEQLLRLGAERK